MVTLMHRQRLEKAVARAEAAYRKRTRPNGRYAAPSTRTERLERARLADAANVARRAAWIAAHPRAAV